MLLSYANLNQLLQRFFFKSSRLSFNNNQLISNYNTMSSLFQELRIDSFSQDRSQSSISFISNQVKVKNQNNPQVQMQASFQKSILKLSIDCTETKRDPYSYIRHYLVLEAKPSNFSRVKQIIELYFKHIEIGDFIKIIMMSSTFKSSKWIQKTKNNTISVQQLISNCEAKSISHLYPILTKVFQKSQQYHNMIAVTVILDQVPSKPVVEQIEKIKDVQKYNNFLKVFALKYNKQYSESQVKSLVKILTKPQKQILSILCNLRNMRLKSLQIKLKCLNGSFVKSKLGNKSWELEGSGLQRTINMLSSQHIYVQQLKINNLIENLDVRVQISLFSMMGDIFKTTGCLKILKQGKETGNHHSSTNCRLIDSKKRCNEDYEDEDSAKSVNVHEIKNRDEVVYLKVVNTGNEI